jgi:glycosyltransferase involved in cell wall biosynthesis
VRILLAHNRYRQRGGEDVVFENERQLLRAGGHDVAEFVVDNSDLAHVSNVSLARTTLWSPRARQLETLVRDFAAEVVHFHNTLPLLSPAAFVAARRGGAAVVQTLHNYRLVCPGGMLFRDGKPCEACVAASVPVAGIRYGCYRESSWASAAVAATVRFQRSLDAFDRGVHVYIALTQFARTKFIQGGFQADRIMVKPNFTFDRAASSRNARSRSVPPAVRSGLLFVGRASIEKGIDVLLDAWQRLGGGPLLTLVADGPESAVLKPRAERLGARWLGTRNSDEVAALMSSHAALVVPSQWYEGFPMVIVEAFAAGLPTVVSAVGGLSELVEDGTTGWHVPVNDSAALAAILESILASPDDAAARGERARRMWEDRYTPEKNLEALLGVYARARAMAK